MTTIGIRLPKGEKEILVENAQRTDTTISQIVRKLIREYVGSVSPSGETAPPCRKRRKASPRHQKKK